MNVAFLGPRGTFSHRAVLQRFGSGASALACPTIGAVFDEVAAGRCRHGVVPVESSSEGAVTHTLDCFLEIAEGQRAPVAIAGEELVPVSHCLVAAEGVRLAAIERVASHPQALAQCRRWLASNLLGADQIPAPSTAEAARTASREPGTAAIASPLAAELYALDVLARDIQDEPGATTRFLVLSPGSDARPPSGNDRTSLLVVLRHEPGALFKALEPLAREGIDLARIESRPLRREAWRYAFFLELDGHRDDEPVARALAALRGRCEHVHLHGSYPRR